ncbi:peptidase [Novosphingobium sp. PC22D]|uniref:retropepsin-like aspartic protease family protein n=1 Tax=Novosphingobium sp. PC22D TaxID=1962403 RepID=UPI000BF022BA|nr:TIGR02281 family clan AA aspartic protease [Novosphingobium sp. PC22D]PEQ13303.1 peptidase [Novosphingobium sp. PC22D]
MDSSSFSDLVDFLRMQPLLTLAIAAIFLTTLGGMIRRSAPMAGGFVRGVGNLGLLAALLLTIAQVTRFTTGNDFALPQLDMPAQVVEGGETRVPMDRDGHFWIRATVNGVEQRFLVDTGATLTAISPRTATQAGVPQRQFPQAVNMRTANGNIRAELATIDELRFGNVVARGLDAVVAPGLGDTNVIGMNLLSRLAAWRVEDNTLILVPNHPQPVTES